MLDDDIEMAADGLFFAGTYFGAGLIFLAFFFLRNDTEYGERMPTGVCITLVVMILVVIPIIAVTVVWIRLVRSRRRLTRSQRVYVR